MTCIGYVLYRVSSAGVDDIAGDSEIARERHVNDSIGR